MGPAPALEERMGPARALEEREKFRKTHPFFNTFLFKIVVLDLHMTFLYGFNVFLCFPAEK